MIGAEQPPDHERGTDVHAGVVHRPEVVILGEDRCRQASRRSRPDADPQRSPRRLPSFRIVEMTPVTSRE